MFDFNASLNDVVPISPILFPFDLMRMEKEWIVGGCYLCFVSFVLLSRLSFMSVVFNFNASLNGFAHAPSMLLSVDITLYKSMMRHLFHVWFSIRW